MLAVSDRRRNRRHSCPDQCVQRRYGDPRAVAAVRARTLMSAHHLCNLRRTHGGGATVPHQNQPMLCSDRNSHQRVSPQMRLCWHCPLLHHQARPRARQHPGPRSIQGTVVAAEHLDLVHPHNLLPLHCPHPPIGMDWRAEKHRQPHRRLRDCPHPFRVLDFAKSRSPGTTWENISN